MNSSLTRLMMKMAGTLETLLISELIPTQLIANRHFRNVLLAKGFKVYYTEYSGGHDYVWWQSTLADGLLALVNP